jgi:hypothetical protein
MLELKRANSWIVLVMHGSFWDNAVGFFSDLGVN